MLACYFIPRLSYSADVVPYTVTLIKSVGSGYVELVGPGKIHLNSDSLPYTGTKYINIRNIGTMTTVYGSSKGCMLAYSSGDYTENISILEQSCNEILTIISKSKE